MNRYKIHRCIILLGLIMGYDQLMGQDLEGFKKRVTEGYATGNQGIWESGLRGLQDLNESQASYNLQFEILLAEYGLIGFLLSQDGKKAQASTQLEKTLTLAHTYAKKYPQKGELKAILGGLYGLKIGLSPVKGMYLGPRSLKYLSQATELSPSHPLVWIEMANAKYHSPSLFGGDMKKAQAYFQKGIELYEKQQNPSSSWVYLHALVWEGKAQEELGNWETAQRSYQKALKARPDFTWVKEELLPQIGKKINP